MRGLMRTKIQNEFKVKFSDKDRNKMEWTFLPYV